MEELYRSWRYISWVLCPGLVSTCLIPIGRLILWQKSAKICWVTLTYAHVLVPTSGSSLIFFPRIFSPVDYFFKFCLSHEAYLNSYIVEKKNCADLPTDFCASCFPKFPGYLCQGAFIFNALAHVSFKPSRTNPGFGRKHNAQFCVELTELDFSTSFLDPGIILLKKNII